MQFVDGKDFERFLETKDEFEKNSFLVFKPYIDICENLIAGILLSRIDYWFRGSKKDGKQRARAKKKDKDDQQWKEWLAKNRNEWTEELRITPKQYDEAIKKLKDKKFVKVQNGMFNGFRTPFILINYDEITKSLNIWSANAQTETEEETPKEAQMVEQISKSGISANGKAVLPKREDRSTQKGKTHNNVLNNDLNKDNAQKELALEFNEFWLLYPKRKDKKAAFDKFKAARKKYSLEEILTGTRNFAAECESKGTDPQFIKYPKTFLHNETFAEYKEIANVKDKTASPITNKLKGIGQKRTPDRNVEW